MPESTNREAEFALATIRQIVINMDEKTALRLVREWATTVHEENAVASLQALVGILPIKEFPRIQKAADAVGSKPNFDSQMVTKFADKLAKNYIRSVRK